MGGLHFEVSQPVEFQVSRFQIRHDRSRLDVGGRLVIDHTVASPARSRNLLVFWFQHFKCDSVESRDQDLCVNFKSAHPSGGRAGHPRADQGRRCGTWVATQDFLPGRAGFLMVVTDEFAARKTAPALHFWAVYFTNFTPPEIPFFC
jgi:hypothetical protein